MEKHHKAAERALEEAVARALRDNLVPLERTADELHKAYADLVAACASSRPSNALPAMLRAQTAAASLAAGLSVLSNFVAVALNPGLRHEKEERFAAPAAAGEAELANPPKSRSLRCRSRGRGSLGGGSSRRGNLRVRSRKPSYRGAESSPAGEPGSQSGHARHQTIEAARRS